MPVEFPRSAVVGLQELASRLFESRKTGGDLESLARDLLIGFYDVCARAGLDRVISDLAGELALDPSERTALADHDAVRAALVMQLGATNLDGGGPRQLKPKQLADCVVAAIALTL